MIAKKFNIKSGNGKNNAASCNIDLSEILNSQLLKDYMIVNKDISLNDDTQMCIDPAAQHDDRPM